jgi:hypothetical protein
MNSGLAYFVWLIITIASVIGILCSFKASESMVSIREWLNKPGALLCCMFGLLSFVALCSMSYEDVVQFYRDKDVYPKVVALLQRYNPCSENNSSKTSLNGKYLVCYLSDEKSKEIPPHFIKGDIITTRGFPFNNKDYRPKAFPVGCANSLPDPTESATYLVRVWGTSNTTNSTSSGVYQKYQRGPFSDKKIGQPFYATDTTTTNYHTLNAAIYEIKSGCLVCENSFTEETRYDFTDKLINRMYDWLSSIYKEP